MQPDYELKFMKCFEMLEKNKMQSAPKRFLYTEEHFAELLQQTSLNEQTFAKLF